MMSCLRNGVSVLINVSRFCETAPTERCEMRVSRSALMRAKAMRGTCETSLGASPRRLTALPMKPDGVAFRTVAPPTIGSSESFPFLDHV